MTSIRTCRACGAGSSRRRPSARAASITRRSVAAETLPALVQHAVDRGQADAGLPGHILQSQTRFRTFHAVSLAE